jgi:hypothetical protein
MHDITKIPWPDLQFALNHAPREFGEDVTTVSYSHWKGKWYTYVTSFQCYEIRAELQRRVDALEVRRGNDLREAHTRQLLKWLQYTRAYGGWFSPYGSGSTYGWSKSEIKAELATRPHIPSGKEAKALRQEAARQARSRRRA